MVGGITVRRRLAAKMEFNYITNTVWIFITRVLHHGVTLEDFDKLAIDVSGLINAPDIVVEYDSWLCF